MKRNVNLALGALALLVPASSAHATAITYGFGCITGNAALNCAVGEAQLRVTVSDDELAASQVRFTLENLGPAASSITDVYFDDGTLLGIASIANGPGVAFSQDASPGNLPGANQASPGFDTTQGFSADSDSPVTANGVQPGESLSIVFDLIEGKDFQSVVSAIQGVIGEDEDLRIGVHVQGFGNGGSESFVNNPTPVAEPGTLLLIGGGLTVLALRRRWRS